MEPGCGGWLIRVEKVVTRNSQSINLYRRALRDQVFFVNLSNVGEAYHYTVCDYLGRIWGGTGSFREIPHNSKFFIFARNHFFFGGGGGAPKLFSECYPGHASAGCWFVLAPSCHSRVQVCAARALASVVAVAVAEFVAVVVVVVVADFMRYYYEH